MLKKFAEIWFYAAFAVSALVALAVVFLLRYHPLVEFFVVVIFAVFYFMTAIVYHSFKGDLTKNIVIEFAGIAAFAIIAFSLLTFWRII